MIDDYSAEIKLRSNPFWNTKVPNEDHRQIAAESRQKLRVLTV